MRVYFLNERPAFLRREIIEVFLCELLFSFALFGGSAWFIVLATFDSPFGFGLAVAYVGIA